MRIARVIGALLLFAVLSFLIFLMLRITAEHLGMETVGFLKTKKAERESSAWLTAFYIHVFSSSVLLFAGFTQFSSKMLSRFPRFHRRMGYTYIIVLLLVSGPAGLYMSFFANGGTISIIGFILLSVLWLFTTIMALRTVLKRQFVKHGAWMILSYALTLSALTLRGWHYLLANIPAELGFERIRPMDIYRMETWLGWVPNFVFALILIWAGTHKKIMARLGSYRGKMVQSSQVD